MSNPAAPAREYGPQGWVGIVTPQANPTVEAEMQRMLPPRVLPLFTRATSRAEDPQQRLLDYFHGLEQSLLSFDTMPLDAAGFACTGSSYLVGQAAEAALIARLEKQLARPVVTATAAIAEELRVRGVSRIFLVAPYPQWLCDSAIAYWTQAGFTVAGLHQIVLGTGDTRAIYALRSPEVSKALAQLDLRGADMVLMSGTGMPTLAALADKTQKVPMLSSNVCLAGALLRRLTLWSPGKPVVLEALLAPRDRPTGQV